MEVVNQATQGVSVELVFILYKASIYICSAKDGLLLWNQL